MFTCTYSALFVSNEDTAHIRLADLYVFIENKIRRFFGDDGRSMEPCADTAVMAVFQAVF